MSLTKLVLQLRMCMAPPRLNLILRKIFYLFLRKLMLYTYSVEDRYPRDTAVMLHASIYKTYKTYAGEIH